MTKRNWKGGRGQTCVIFWIELQILLVPGNWIFDGDDEIRHVLPDILLLLTMLLEDTWSVGKCEWPISRKPEKYSVEKIISEFTVVPPTKDDLLKLAYFEVAMRKNCYNTQIFSSVNHILEVHKGTSRIGGALVSLNELLTDYKVYIIFI